MGVEDGMAQQTISILHVNLPGRMHKAQVNVGSPKTTHG